MYSSYKMYLLRNQGLDRYRQDRHQLVLYQHTLGRHNMQAKLPTDHCLHTLAVLDLYTLDTHLLFRNQHTLVGQREHRQGMFQPNQGLHKLEVDTRGMGLKSRLNILVGVADTPGMVLQNHWYRLVVGVDMRDTDQQNR